MTTRAQEEVVLAAIGQLALGVRLDRAGARAFMNEVLHGAATPAQLGAALMALRLRGETPEEIAGFVEAMRNACVRVEPVPPETVDLCGTGGDGAGTVNISTGAALLAAAAGAKVAKHGNRSASSRCGSADVVEAMGIPIDLDPKRAAEVIAKIGFVFLFAPAHHPAMRHAAAVRKELGLRTVFNILGPLASPAGVRRQLVGVYDDRLRALVAQALRELGSEHVWVVHASSPQPHSGFGGGLDELSIAGPTRVTELIAGQLREIVVEPESAGIQRRPLEGLRGGDAAENARILADALTGIQRGAVRDALVLNAAAALVVAGVETDLRTGALRARQAIDTGRAKVLLDLARSTR